MDRHMLALQMPRTHSCTKIFRALFLLYCLLSVIGCSSGEGEAAADLSSIASDIATLSAATNGSSNDASEIEVEGQCELSILDEGVLRELNEVRAEARMCGDTFYDAVDPVTWNCTLEGAAESHSLDMGNNNSLIMLAPMVFEWGLDRMPPATTGLWWVKI